MTASFDRERPVRHAERKRRAERYGKPDDTTGQKAPDTLRRLGAHTRLPKRLVDEDRTETTCNQTGARVFLCVTHAVVRGRMTNILFA